MTGWLTLQPGQSPGVLVHVGAGEGSDVADYLAAGLTNIILIEPSPDNAKTLMRLEKEHAVVSVVTAALVSDLGAAATQTTLHMLNHRDLSAIVPPRGLEQLLPGIEELQSLDVDAQTVDQLRDRLSPLETNCMHCLVIEAAGIEAALFRAFAETGFLNEFTRLRLRCAAKVYYDGAEPAQSVLNFLWDRGFWLIDTDNTDPDWPVYTLVQTNIRAVGAVAKLEERIETLSAAKDDLSARLQIQQTDLATSQRLNVLRSADLCALQTRYQTLEKECESMRELLRAVSGKLQAASEYAPLVKALDAAVSKADGAPAA